MSGYRDLLGVPFKVHGRSREEGFDCYGLAIEVLRRNGKTLPDIPYRDLKGRTDTRNSIVCFNCIEPLNECEMLCLIEIEDRGSPSHCAVYIGEGRMIHAVEKLGVVIERVAKYEKRITGYYRCV